VLTWKDWHRILQLLIIKKKKYEFCYDVFYLIFYGVFQHHNDLIFHPWIWTTDWKVIFFWNRCINFKNILNQSNFFLHLRKKGKKGKKNNNISKSIKYNIWEEHLKKKNSCKEITIISFSRVHLYCRLVNITIFSCPRLSKRLVT
jgi:hypothetical protein